MGNTSATSSERAIRAHGHRFAGVDRRETPNADVLVRAYPQRVAGRPIRYAYDPMTRTLELLFVDKANVDRPTEIHVPARRFYAQGWHLEVSDPEGAWSSAWDPSREVLSITTPRTGGTHQIRIVPADTPGAAS